MIFTTSLLERRYRSQFGMLIAFNRLQATMSASKYSQRQTKSPRVKRQGSMFRYLQYMTMSMPAVARKRKTGMKMVYQRGALALQKVSVTQKAPNCSSNLQQEMPPRQLLYQQACIRICLSSDYNDNLNCEMFSEAEEYLKSYLVLHGIEKEEIEEDGVENVSGYFNEEGCEQMPKVSVVQSKGCKCWFLLLLKIIFIVVSVLFILNGQLRREEFLYYQSNFDVNKLQ